jgi:opacity protein-like surface antigen
MKLRPNLLLAAALAAACAGGASAQTTSQAVAVACPKAHEVVQQHLLGLWRADFEGLAQGATLLLEQHPELAESVRGGINRNGERAEVSGDVDDGEFTLEESENGVNISATWLGDMVEGSCGREIRGTWQAEGDRRARGFVLRKQ